MPHPSHNQLGQRSSNWTAPRAHRGQLCGKQPYCWAGSMNNRTTESHCRQRECMPPPLPGEATTPCGWKAGSAWPFSSHLSVGLGHPRLCLREVVRQTSCSSRTAKFSPSSSLWWLPAQSSRLLSLLRVKLKIQLNTHSVLFNDVDDAGLWRPLCNCSHPFLLLKTRERSFFAFCSLIPGYLIRNLFSYCEMLLASQNGDFSWEFTKDWVNLGRSLEN